MVRTSSISRQRLIFHYCSTCNLPVRHASKSSHKGCSFKEDGTYLYCLTCKAYLKSTEKANSEEDKTFIQAHTTCALGNGRKGINLTSTAEKRKLERLFAKEDRPATGVLSQCDEVAKTSKPPKKTRSIRVKSRKFIDSDTSLSDYEVSTVKCLF